MRLYLLHSDTYEEGNVRVRVDCYSDGRERVFYEVNGMFSVELSEQDLRDTKLIVDSVLSSKEKDSNG